MVGEGEGRPVDAEVEEGDVKAVEGQALGLRGVAGPVAAVEVEHRVEEPGGDLPCQRAPPVDQLRHLQFSRPTMITHPSHSPSSMEWKEQDPSSAIWVLAVMKLAIWVLFAIGIRLEVMTKIRV